MRARSLAPGLAAVGVLAASGCGSDGTTTVTVATGDTTTVTAPTTGTSPTTTAVTTVVRTTPSATRAPTPVARTVTTSVTRPTTTALRATPDPVGGTVPSRGRVRGVGYSVTVPTGWADGSRRFEGDESAYDLNLVKRPGADPVSVIFTDRRRPDGLGRRSLADLADDLRDEVVGTSSESRITTGPDLRVDGEDAVSFFVRRTLGGRRPIRQHAIAVRHGGVLVVIRLTAPVSDYRADSRLFARFLASWRWDRPRTG